jgi:hypothetical protein
MREVLEAGRAHGEPARPVRLLGSQAGDGVGLIDLTARCSAAFVQNPKFVATYQSRSDVPISLESIRIVMGMEAEEDTEADMLARDMEAARAAP